MSEFGRAASITKRPWHTGGHKKKFPGGKREEREADHSPLPSAETKNAWN